MQTWPPASERDGTGPAPLPAEGPGEQQQGGDHEGVAVDGPLQAPGPRRSAGLTGWSWSDAWAGGDYHPPSLSPPIRPRPPCRHRAARGPRPMPQPARSPHPSPAHHPPSPACWPTVAHCDGVCAHQLTAAQASPAPASPTPCTDAGGHRGAGPRRSAHTITQPRYGGNVLRRDRGRSGPAGSPVPAAARWRTGRPRRRPMLRPFGSRSGSGRPCPRGRQAPAPPPAPHVARGR
jgi:hypothetical protein